MLLSELCVISVFVPAHVALTVRGRGGQLKFRFSPYSRIEFLRVAILKVRGRRNQSIIIIITEWVWVK